MQVADISGIVDSWSAEVDEIYALVENWEGAVIEIEVTQEQLESNTKYQKIMKKWNIFKEKIEERLKGLRNKIIAHLHEIYDKATTNLEPYKTIAEMLLNIGPDLGAIVKALKAIGQYFMQAYMEALQTMQAVITLVTKVIALTQKLANFRLPTIVLKDKTKVSLSPPEWEPITLDDVIAGPDEIA